MSKCIGVFKNGKKCNYTSKNEGYCNGHYKRYLLEKDIKISNSESESESKEEDINSNNDNNDTNDTNDSSDELTSSESSETKDIHNHHTNHKKPNDNKVRKVLPKVAKLIELDKHAPEQKSKEWLALRKQMITASDIAAALVLKNHELNLIDAGVVSHYKKTPKVGDPSDKNKNLKKLYMKKCDPTSKEAQFKGNMYTFHGETHEDSACTMYSHKMDCEVIELGVMQHPKYKFLGASPDGINIENGTMLEIKVPYSREITGVPTLGYWMQMQTQMQCCDLYECDFVECKITDYNNEDEFLEDTYVDPDSGKEVYGLTKEGEMKGCTIQLIIEKEDGEVDHKNGKCCPMMLNSHDELSPFVDKCIMEFMTENNCKLAQAIALYTGRCYLNKVFWKCTQYSQVRVKRDDEWFRLRLPDLERVWNNIVKFREEGLPESLRKSDSNNTYSKKASKPQLDRNQSTFNINQGELELKSGGASDDGKGSKFRISDEDDEDEIYERLLKERNKNNPKPVKPVKTKSTFRIEPDEI